MSTGNASNRGGNRGASSSRGGKGGASNRGGASNNKAGATKAAPAAAKPAATTSAAPAAAKPAAAAAPAAAKPAAAKPAASTAAAKPAAASTTAAKPAAAAKPASTKPKQPRVKKSVIKSAAKKVVKRKGAKTSKYEKSVAQALYDVQSKGEGVAALKDLHITGAREIEIGAGKKATILFVPVPQLKRFKAIQGKLVQELEKSAAFRDRQIFIVAARTILPTPTKKNRVSRQQRPRNRTVTAVHEAILDDLVYPSEIVGKSVRVKLDNSRVIRVQLDPKDRDRSKNKTEAYASVYRKLTGKTAVFEFPAYSLADLQGHLAAEKAARQQTTK